ncbi:DUF6531 domain-containing protein, partial [Escherichia coli]|uniref:DUF6531 domain-containing protein n=1 Tax=Escherichia coli TaxID=562 RepID=UPI0021BB6D8B
MSGKPAARQGDMTQYGGPIVQGSAGVRIGAPTGVACSVCPGGMTSGNPVNPLLGAKVLPGETDLALPGPLPFILSRTYSSYRTKTPAPVGIFGPGWKAPSDIRLQIRDDALVLNDNGGRSIHFEPLLPGEAVYSRSESLWLVRGGKATQPDGHTLARLWASLPPDIRLSPHLYLATNSAQGPWWILGWSELVPGAEDVLPAPLPPYRVLTGLADRFGRTLTYRREAAGDLAGEITGVTDGAGREFRLVLTTQAQRAEEARKQRTASLSSPDTPRPLSASAFPDTLPGTEYGPDRGIRLSAVWLMHDPAYPESLPGAPLARYTYTEAGELLAVYDRSNTQVRAFTYDAQHPGRMVAHRYAGRPEMRYRYDDTGVACSVCPGGMTSGNPVNPLLGAKVLPGETDLALPGPLPFILSRTYSSYRTRTPAPVGVFGPGWKAPSDIRLQLRDDALVLNDNGGRSIHFEPLLPGEAVYSRSESMWLVRGGKAAQPDGHTLARLWGALPPDIRLSPHLYLATNSAQGPWWILGWSERVPGAEDVLPAPLPPYRELTGLADRFGRTLAYRREAAGDLAGEITGVTDGAGREFRLVLTTQAQRAEEARTSSLSSSDSSRPLSASPFPDTLPGTEYGPDRGIRLSAVWLMHDPAYPESLPGAPLARYTYTEAGELLAVYDRSNTQVRAFTYDAQHPGRMVAHRYAGRPEMRYRYDDTGRVVEQLNPAGLSYRYLYEQDRITVTDSLNRREVLHTEGGAGLKRVVKKELADGSVTRSGYDAAGRLTAQTDAAGRRTEYGLNVVSGDITDITTPDGRETKFYYNDGNQLTAVVSPDGLESRREYDEPGRLVSETSRSGETVRYRYDDAHSELPATTTDATGSTRQMTWSRYGQLLAFTDCSGYQTRYEYDRFGQMTAVHREEGISLYRRYDNRGRLTSVKDAQGRETRYEYNAAGDLTAVITPDGNRSETQYDAWGKAVSTTQGGLTRSMEYDAAGRVISLTNENGSHSDFSYDALDRLVQQGGFDGRTQRYHYDLTGKLTQSEDEGLVTLWHYDASDRITHRTVNGDPAEQWQY